MAEPIHEATEVAWLEALDRFDKEIYPLLFEPRGYSKEAAFIAWRLAGLSEEIVELRETIEAM